MKNSKKPRSTRTIRFSDEEERQIEKAADREHRSFSAFVRLAALNAAKEAAERKQAQAA